MAAEWVAKGFCRLFPSHPLCKEDPENPELPQTPEDRENFFIFTPFYGQDGIGLEQVVILLISVKLAKTPEGLKVLRDLGIQYLKTLGVTLEALERSSSQSWLTALINQKLSLNVFRRLGLISATDAMRLEVDYNHIFSITMAKEGITETLTALGTFFSGSSEMATAMMTGGG